VETKVAQLEVEGIRASYLHKPIYHHKSRMATTEGGHSETFSLENAIAEYVETADVSTIGLDED